MLIPIKNITTRNFIDACLTAGRNVQVFAKFVTDAAGDGTSTMQTFDRSEIKDINITGSLTTGEFSVGNVPSRSLKMTIFSATPISMKFPGDWQDNDKSVWDNNWIEIFFSPSTTATFTKAEVNALPYGSMPTEDTLPAKYKYLARIGVFYVTNSYNFNGVQTIEAVDSIGTLFDNEYVSTIATYPATISKVMVDALTQIGSFNIGTTHYDACPNATTITISEPLVGYTCREVLQMCLACCGGNLQKEETTTEWALLPEERLGFDRYFVVVYPGGFYAKDVYDNHNGSLSAAINDYYSSGYTATATAGQVLSADRVNAWLKIGAVQYGDTVSYGSGIQSGSKYNLIIPGNPIMDSLNATQLMSALDNLADLYKNFEYRPASLRLPSCPILTPLDYLYFEDRYGSTYATLITSTNMSGIGSQSVTSAGNSVGTNNALTQKSRNQTTRVTQGAQIEVLSSDMAAVQSDMANLTKWVDVSDTSTGLFIDSRSITTTSAGYYRYTDYGRDNYRLLSVYETGVSNGYVVITASVSGQYVRVFQANGTAAASSTVTLNAVFLKIS